jgi:hypothetical protein
MSVRQPSSSIGDDTEAQGDELIQILLGGHNENKLMVTCLPRLNSWHLSMIQPWNTLKGNDKDFLSTLKIHLKTRTLYMLLHLLYFNAQCCFYFKFL